MSPSLLSGASDGSPVPSMPSARSFEQNLNPAFAFGRIVRPNFSSDALRAPRSCGFPFNDGPWNSQAPRCQPVRHLQNPRFSHVGRNHGAANLPICALGDQPAGTIMAQPARAYFASGGTVAKRFLFPPVIQHLIHT